MLAAGLAALLLAIVGPNVRAGGLLFTNFDGPPDNTQGTTVNGINNLGQAIGFSTAANGAFNNFIRNVDGSLTSVSFVGSAEAMANGLNANGQVVGSLGSTAFFLTNGGNTVITIPSVTGTTTAEAAFGINDRGTIVGQYTDSATGSSPGFVLAKGFFTSLNPVSNDAQVFAQGINNNGLVVGFYNTDGAHDHGFLFNTNTNSYTLLSDPNVSNLLFTQFLGINDHNEAVGYYQTNDGSQHGFLYNIGTGMYSFADLTRMPRRAACRSRRLRESATPEKSTASTSMRRPAFSAVSWRWDPYPSLAQLSCWAWVRCLPAASPSGEPIGTRRRPE